MLSQKSFLLQTLTMKLKMGSGEDSQCSTSGERALLPQPRTSQLFRVSAPRLSWPKKRCKSEFGAAKETPIKTLPRAQTLWLLLGPSQRLPARARRQPSPARSVSGGHWEKRVTPDRAGEPPRSCCTLAPIHQRCPGLELQSRGHPSHTNPAQLGPENLVLATGGFPPAKGKCLTWTYFPHAWPFTHL